MRQERRQLAVWTATHDNGWTTGVAENPDGTFAAWVTNQAGSVRPDYIEDSPENGMRAAVYALERKTGHRCSPDCSDWQLHLHESDDSNTTTD